jgi:hypothetical protein
MKRKTYLISLKDLKMYDHTLLWLDFKRIVAVANDFL